MKQPETLPQAIHRLERVRAQRDDLLLAMEAIRQVLDGTQPKDPAGALMIARAAIVKHQPKYHT